MKKPTAKEQIASILQENRGKTVKSIINTTNIIDLIKRDIASYNDRITKNKSNQDKISYSKSIKELKENPTRTTLNKIINSTGKGYIKNPPKETLSFDKMTEKQQKKYLEKMQQKMEKETIRRIEKNKVLGLQKKIKESLGIKITQKKTKELGDVFKVLRENNKVPHYITSNEVVQMVANKDFDEIHNLLLNVKDSDSAEKINEILGIELFEYETEDFEGDDSDQIPIFGG